MKKIQKKSVFSVGLTIILGAILFLGSCNFFGPTRTTNTYTGGTGGTIVDNATTDFTLEVSGSGELYQVRGVTLSGLSHEYAADLEFFLLSPAGSEVILFRDQGGSYDFDGNYTFMGAWYSETNFAYYALGDTSDASSVTYGFWDGYGSTSIIADTYYFDFTNYDFDGSGETVNGTWTLRIIDDTGIYEGSFTSWELIVNHYEAE